MGKAKWGGGLNMGVLPYYNEALLEIPHDAA